MQEDGLAVVIGASGGIGSAFVRQIDAVRFDKTIGLSRRSDPPLDILDEQTVRRAAAQIATIGAPRLIIVATGLLHGDGVEPEKALSRIDPAAMATSYAVNAIGPALVMKHFLPLMPRHGTAVFAVLSARVGSISDNNLGGWYSYRAAKAALNQLVRTAAIELRRTHPEAACIAIHPGTVKTGLSQKFAKTGLQVQEPDDAARDMLDTFARLEARDSGTFVDRHGQPIAW